MQVFQFLTLFIIQSNDNIVTKEMHKKKISESNIENRNPLVSNNNKTSLHVSRPSEGSFTKKDKQNENHTLLEINPLKLNLNKNSKASSKNNTDRNMKDSILPGRENRSIDFQIKEKENLNTKKIILSKEGSFKQKPVKTYLEIQREKNHLRSSSKNLQSISSQQYLRLFLSDQKSTSQFLPFDSNFNFQNDHSESQINDFNLEEDAQQKQIKKCCKNESILQQIVYKLNETNNLQSEISYEKIIIELKDRISWLQQELKQKNTKCDSLQTRLSQSELQITLKNKEIDLYKTTIQRYSDQKMKLQSIIEKYQNELKTSSQKILQYEIKHKVVVEKINQDFTQQLSDVTSQLSVYKQSHTTLQKQTENLRKEISGLRKENLLLRKEMQKYKILTQDIIKKSNEFDKDIQKSNLKLLKSYENQLEELKCEKNNHSTIKTQQFEIVKELTILLQNTQKELNATKKAKNSSEMKIQFIDKTHTSEIQWMKQNYIRDIKGLKQKIQIMAKQIQYLKQQLSISTSLPENHVVITQQKQVQSQQ